MINDTQKEMADIAKAHADRVALLAKATADGEAAKKAIRDKADADCAAVDAKVQAIAQGQATADQGPANAQ